MRHEKDNLKTMPEDSPCGDAWGGSLVGREKSSGFFNYGGMRNGKNSSRANQIHKGLDVGKRDNRKS